MRTGEGRAGLTRQGLGKRIVTQAVGVRGGGQAEATVRELATLDMIQVAARGLAPQRRYVVALTKGGTEVPVARFTSDAKGSGDALAFTSFFGTFERVVVRPAGR
jgi:hypothetical protein